MMFTTTVFTTTSFNYKALLRGFNRQLIRLVQSLLLSMLFVSYGYSNTQHIVVLGDSISAAYGVPTEQGWVALLQDRLNTKHKQYTVINASISGETTDGGLRRLTDILERHQPAFILIELGGNDGLRGFPLKVIRSNLEKMVEQSKSMEVTPLLLAMRIPPNYGKRYSSGFYNIFPETAQAHDISLIPFLLEDVATQPEMMQTDGIHPTALAQPILLDAVWGTLEPLL